ncbi:MAG: hypothetical protein IT317_20250 [Anaerolineales bacterium]|nr:hypothetical protein [Anaerolineales bacterium]
MCTVFGWPKPAGPLPVGTQAWPLVDPRRADPFGPTGPDGGRTLLVNAWYPATAAEGSRLGGTVGFPEGGVLYPRPPFTLLARQGMLPNTLRRLVEHHGLPGAALSQVTHLTTHARAGAPLAAGPWPVLLFSHGYGLENAVSSSYLMEALASHGYVVLSVSHPGESLAAVYPDGRLAALDVDDPRLAFGARLAEVRAESGPWGRLASESLALWTADLQTVLADLERLNAPGPDNAWAGQLELTRIGALGVGFGGSAALALAAADPRVQAVAALDGRWAAGVGETAAPVLSQPALMLGRSPAAPTPPGALSLTLLGARSLHFTGVALWFPILAQLADFDSGNVYRYLQALNAYALAFFERELRGAPAPLLAGPDPAHPEVAFAAA